MGHPVDFELVVLILGSLLMKQITGQECASRDPELSAAWISYPLVLTRKRTNPRERSSIGDQKLASHFHAYASRQLFSEARVTPPLIFGSMINSNTVTSESST